MQHATLTRHHVSILRSGSGVPRMSAERLYATISAMVPAGAGARRPTVLVCTDRPQLLREGPWALKLQMEYKLRTIYDFWHIVRHLQSRALRPATAAACHQVA